MIFNEKTTSGVPGAKSRIIKLTPGKLFRLSGTNTGADCYIQLFDAVAAPGAGDKPIFETVGQGAFVYDVEFGEHGMPFLTGIVAAASTTAQSYAAIPGDTVTFNAIYS